MNRTPLRNRFFRRSRHLAPPTLGLAAVLACLVVAMPDDPALAADLGSDKPTVPHAADDAMTRESMADLNRAEPASPAVTSMTPIRPTPSRVHARVDSKDFVPRHQNPRHRPVVRSSPKTGQTQAAGQASRRRNPAVRFVYWWNGWVIRTFHTKIGTVLLGKVGAKA